MKQIGRTQIGEHIVTLTRDETHALTLLHRVASGKVVNFSYPEDVELDTDYAEVFGAIRVWLQQANTVNELQGGVDRMREMLGMPGRCKCEKDDHA